MNSSTRAHRIIRVVLVVSCALLPSVTFAQMVPPTAVNAHVRQFNKIDISWDAVSQAVGYVVYKNSTPLATTTSTSYTYPYVTLPGNTYCLSVMSYDAASSYSPLSSQTCTPIVRGTAPTPTELTASQLSSSAVSLHWKYPVSAEQVEADPVDGYTVAFFIERSVDAGSTWTLISQQSKSFFPGDSLEVTYQDSSAGTGASNMYRVTALHETADGFSAASETASVAIAQAETVPTAPSELAIDYSTATVPTEVTLTWKDNANDEVGVVIEKKSGDTWTEFHRYDYPNTTMVRLPTLSSGVTYQFRVRARNTAGLSLPSNTVEVIVPGPLTWTQPSASKNLLIVYNTDDPRSVDVKNYYLNNRPGISGANVLGLTFPALTLDSGGYLSQLIDTSVFTPNILTPITQWLIDNPDKPIRYVVFMYGMPSIVMGCGGTYNQCNSAQYQVSRALQIKGVRDGVEYRGGRSTRYMPEYYRGTTALVTTLDMGSVAATKGYIDKLKKVYDQMADKDIIISAKNAGIGGTTYYFEDKGDALNIGEQARSAVLSVNPSATVMYKPNSTFSTAENVLGYSTHGTWGGLAKNFPLNGSVIFTGNSGWYLLRTGESWNGIYNNVHSGQSNPTVWFAQKAFGGSNYENTPVGAVTQVIEPGGAGLASKELFTAWEKGYTFGEAAWSARNMAGFLAVGDPLVANSGTAPIVVQQTDTTPPSIVTGSPQGTLSASTRSVTLSVTTNENATCKYSQTANTSYTASGNTSFSTTGGTSHSVGLTGMTSGTTYRYYVRCRDTASNVMSADYTVLFSIASEAPEADVTAPSALVNYPSAGSVISAGSVGLQALASDVSGVSRVTFYLDGQKIGEDTSSPYGVTVTLDTAGTHRIYVIARDTAGNESTSPTVQFNIAANKAVVKKPETNTTNTGDTTVVKVSEATEPTGTVRTSFVVPEDEATTSTDQGDSDTTFFEDVGNFITDTFVRIWSGIVHLFGN